MNKIIISAVVFAAIGLTTASATVSDNCGYDADGNFILGNGQVSAYGSWEHAKDCAMKGILPAVVAKRLGSVGDESIQREADILREINTRIQEEKKRREIEAQPLPSAK